MTVLVSGALQFRRFSQNEQGDGSAVPVVQPPLSCSMKLGWVAVHAFPRKNSFSLPRAARCDSAVSSFGSALPPTGFPGPVAGRVSQQGLGRSWSATGEKVQLGPLDGKAGLWSPEPRASPRWSVVSTRAGTASHRLQHASCGLCLPGLLTRAWEIIPAALFSCGSSGSCDHACEGCKACV